MHINYTQIQLYADTQNDTNGDNGSAGWRLGFGGTLCGVACGARAVFVVNVVGCLLIGLVCGLAARLDGLGNGLKLFLTVGFCGGFTTFSTFCNENLALLRGGALLTAALYAALSLFVGLLAVYAGLLIARQ